MSNFEPETEAYVKLPEWGNIVVPCFIEDIHTNGKAIKSEDDITEESIARVNIWIGAGEDLNTTPVSFKFEVPLSALSEA